MFHRRLIVLWIVISAIMLVIMAKLAYLQVFQGEHYRQLAERKIAYRDTLPSLRRPVQRGDVLDRNGIRLAGDEYKYDLCVHLRGLASLDAPNAWFDGLAKLIPCAPVDVAAAVDEVEAHLEALAFRGPAWRQKADLKYLRSQPQCLFSGLTRDQITRIETREEHLPRRIRDGRPQSLLTVRRRFHRVYPQRDLASHIVGYLAPVSREEFSDRGYRFTFDGDKMKRFFENDLIGRSGIEARYEKRLRGTRGMLTGIKNVRGDIVRQMPTFRREPKPGRDVRLTLDAELQKLAEHVLDGTILELHRIRHAVDPPICGAFVLIDLHNGDVLAAASAPRYDLNTVRRNWKTLADEKDMRRPLVHRATMGTYPIGSVFKLVVATAGLEENVLSGHTEFTCDGAFLHGNRILRCTGTHGTLELTRATERSCNAYFFQAGLKVGGTRMTRWAGRLGLGVRSGADLGELPGKIPVCHSDGDVLNLTIGQGAMLCTPLQVARMTGCIATGGMLPDTRFCLEKPVRVERVAMHPERLRALVWGMHDAIHGSRGTAHSTARVFSDATMRHELIYAGKTGTAQTRLPDVYHAWFAGFAPFKNPTVAFACVIENTRKGGGHAAGPVVRRVFTDVLRHPRLKRLLEGGVE